MRKIRWVFILAGFGWGSTVFAQNTTPYLKSAFFTISVDDWADISLNGIPIIDSLPYTSAASGPKTVVCLPKHICYFKRENILAIEVNDKSVGVTMGQDGVGIAYILHLSFSDGRELELTSDDAADHESLYIPDRMSGNPRGWQTMTFDDGAWRKAFGTGPSVPFAAKVVDPGTNLPVSFLSARAASSDSQKPGERHLFRRKFFLNIGNNPNCDSPMAPPRIEPVVVGQPDKRHPVRPPTPTNTPTPTPIPTPTEVIYPAPISSPVLDQRMVPPRAPRRLKLVPTPAWIFVPTVSEKGEGVLSEPMAGLRERLSPTPSSPAAVGGDQGQTIVFDRPPANIFMSFADGPGVYRLEVTDKDGRHLRDLYEKRIVAQKEDWAEWNGKDDLGLDCPRGWYYVLFSKDGKLLKKILAGKTSNN